MIFISPYQHMIDEMFDKVGQAVGVHVILLIIEHSLWKTRQRFKNADLISFSEKGVVLDDLGQLDPEESRAIAEEFITMFAAALGRLVGKQVAQQLTEQLQDRLIENMEK